MRFLVTAQREADDSRGELKADRIAFDTLDEALAWCGAEAIRPLSTDVSVPWTVGSAPMGYPSGIWEMQFSWPVLPANMDNVLPQPDVRRRLQQHADRMGYLTQHFEALDGVISVLIEREDRATSVSGGGNRS